MRQETTHFGFQQVPIKDKAKRVADVFHSVASKYDLMNDLMSMGLHRYWKHFAISQSQVRQGDSVLDVAGGTGDLTRAFLDRVGDNGYVVLTDINEKMLIEGRSRMLDDGILQNIAYVQADAENLPFPSNYFDCVSIAFGLRNVTHKQIALESMYRTLKPGGKLLVLEFSKPIIPLLNTLYDKYSFKVIPFLGDMITGDRKSYEYLVESIRMHPHQEDLKILLQNAGFEDVDYHNLSGGIVALHTGYKY